MLVKQRFHPPIAHSLPLNFRNLLLVSLQIGVQPPNHPSPIPQAVRGLIEVGEIQAAIY